MGRTQYLQGIIKVLCRRIAVLYEDSVSPFRLYGRTGGMKRNFSAFLPFQPYKGGISVHRKRVGVCVGAGLQDRTFRRTEHF